MIGLAGMPARMNKLFPLAVPRIGIYTLLPDQIGHKTVTIKIFLQCHSMIIYSPLASLTQLDKHVIYTVIHRISMCEVCHLCSRYVIRNLNWFFNMYPPKQKHIPICGHLLNVGHKLLIKLRIKYAIVLKD